jgi:hypothetical protein
MKILSPVAGCAPVYQVCVEKIAVAARIWVPWWQKFIQNWYHQSVAPRSPARKGDVGYFLKRIVGYALESLVQVYLFRIIDATRI